MGEVLFVDDNASDCALAGIAIALRRPGTRVQEVRTLTQALNRIGGENPPRLVILGWRALKEAPAQLNGGKTAYVGFASNLTEADRQRARGAGVRAIYDRPQDWRPFCDALEALLNDCLGMPARP